MGLWALNKKCRSEKVEKAIKSYGDYITLHTSTVIKLRNDELCNELPCMCGFFLKDLSGEKLESHVR